MMAIAHPISPGLYQHTLPRTVLPSSWNGKWSSARRYSDRAPHCAAGTSCDRAPHFRAFVAELQWPREASVHVRKFHRLSNCRWPGENTGNIRPCVPLCHWSSPCLRTLVNVHAKIISQCAEQFIREIVHCTEMRAKRFS